MARLPVDPLLARMLIEAQKWGCIDEVSVIAAALSIQDPRERPAQSANEADQAQALFVDPKSDFLTLLNIWNRYHETWRQVKTGNQMKKFCRKHFLSFRRMREWRDIHKQLGDILIERGFHQSARRPEENDEQYAGIHRSILSGLLANIGVRKEKNFFRAAKGREVMVFPGSSIFNRAGEWIVAAEMVETSRLFARVAANIDVNWLEELGGNLCRFTYLNPRWDSRRGEVVATQQVSLFGLVIVPGRNISYGRIDSDVATDVFVRSALVNEELEHPFKFMRHNAQLVRQIQNMENRIRRRDILVEDEERVRFYKKRLVGVYSRRHLTRLLQKRGNDDFLCMKLEDLMNYQPNSKILERYPESIDLGGGTYMCSYRFEPSQPEDGLTVKIPAVSAPAVPAGETEWLVPGLLSDKIESLLRALPKRYRKQLVPIARTVEIVLKEMPRDSGALISALGKFIYQRFGIDVPATAWSPKSLPAHLTMRIAVTGSGGEVIQSSRNPQILKQLSHGDPLPLPDGWEAARRQWERTGVVKWDFGDLPDSIELDIQGGGQWAVFPGLALVESSSGPRIDLRLFQTRETAVVSHVKGVAELYRIHFSKDLKFLKKHLVLPPNHSAAARYFGGLRNLEKRIYQTVDKSLFQQNIRSRDQFLAKAESLAARIIPTGRDLTENILPVIDAYHTARTTIHQLEVDNPANQILAEFCRRRKEELSHLIPDGFFGIYDLDRLKHLPRYIKTIDVRTHRASVNFEKEKLKAAELTPFSSGLRRLIKSLSPSATQEKRDALEDFFWLIEEFKVSLFAQELKTAVPVSKKRLKQAMSEIERMV